MSLQKASYWFVNVGEDGTGNRDWDDCTQYGFISAGQGKIYSDPLKKLKFGDVIFAYLKRYRQGVGGYVGFGEIISETIMAKDFVIDGKNLLETHLRGSHLKNKDNVDNPELSEYVVGVKWIKTFSKKSGRFFF